MKNNVSESIGSRARAKKNFRERQKKRCLNVRRSQFTSLFYWVAKDSIASDMVESFATQSMSRDFSASSTVSDIVVCARHSHNWSGTVSISKKNVYFFPVRWPSHEQRKAVAQRQYFCVRRSRRIIEFVRNESPQPDGIKNAQIERSGRCSCCKWNYSLDS